MADAECAHAGMEEVEAKRESGQEEAEADSDANVVLDKASGEVENDVLAPPIAVEAVQEVAVSASATKKDEHAPGDIEGKHENESEKEAGAMKVSRVDPVNVGNEPEVAAAGSPSTGDDGKCDQDVLDSAQTEGVSSDAPTAEPPVVSASVAAVDVGDSVGGDDGSEADSGQANSPSSSPRGQRSPVPGQRPVGFVAIAPPVIVESISGNDQDASSGKTDSDAVAADALSDKGQPDGTTGIENIEHRRATRAPSVLGKLPIVDRSNRQLTEIEPELLQRQFLTKLFFFSNFIAEIPSTISNLQKLKVLDLSYNRLTIIPEELCALKCLEELLLAGNRVSVFPDHMDELESLWRLDLTSNHLRVFPEEITFIPQLSRLDIGRNFIKYLPAEIRYMRCLERFDLSENKLKSLPPQVGFCSDLRQIFLSDNKLSYLPDEIQFWEQLEVLHVARNRLESLPFAMAALTQLGVLDIANNWIEELPTEVFFAEWSVVGEDQQNNSEVTRKSPDDSAESREAIEEEKIEKYSSTGRATPHTPDIRGEYDDNEELSCDSGLGFLRELLARGNKISVLPENFWQLTMLETLDITDNMIEGPLSPGIGELTSLVCFKASGNKITSIPEEICHLEALQEVNVSANALTYLPEGLPWMCSLESLSVGYNSIAAFPEFEGSTSDLPFPELSELFVSGCLTLTQLPDYLGRCIQLRNIYASKCALEEVPQTLKDCANLSVLDVSRNGLAAVPEALAECRLLTRLDFSHNALTNSPDSLPPALLGELPLLKDVNLTGNALTEEPAHVERVRMELEGVVHLALNPCYGDLSEVRAAIEQSTSSDVSSAETAEMQLLNPVLGDSVLFRVGWTDMCGRRPEMEDDIVIRANWRQATDLCGIDEDEEEGAREGPVDLFAVFDGHAGTAASRFCASRTAHLLGLRLEDEYPVEALKHSMHDLNSEFREWIRDKDINVKHAGTTALVGLFTQTHLYLANLGDTRAVVCRGGTAVPLTIDHKPMDEEDRINALGGFVTTVPGGRTRRINGMIAVSRSIGDFYMNPFVIAKPYMCEQAIDPTDEFIILACDGIWDEIDNQHAVDLIRSIDDPFIAASTLRDHAYIRDSDDNISVVVLRLQSAPKPQAPQRPPRRAVSSQAVGHKRRATRSEIKRTKSTRASKNENGADASRKNVTDDKRSSNDDKHAKPLSKVTKDEKKGGSFKFPGMSKADKKVNSSKSKKSKKDKKT